MASSPACFSTERAISLHNTGDRVFLKMSYHLCVSGCGRSLAPQDGDDRCLTCLGIQHTEEAFVDGSCSSCGDMTISDLRNRLPLPLPRSGVRPGTRGGTASGGVRGDLRITVRASPSGFPHPSSTPQPAGVPLVRTGASTEWGTPPVSFGAPPDDLMSIAASEGSLSLSGDDDSAALPPSGKSVGKHNLVVRFLCQVSFPSLPSWDLALVLRALITAPFEPLQSVELKFLSMKTLLLTALASIKRVGNLQAFSVDDSCLEFGPADSSATLRPRPGYVPKVPTTPFRDQVVNLQALPLEKADPALALLCPVRALRQYTDRTQSFRTSVTEDSRRGRLFPSRGWPTG